MRHPHQNFLADVPLVKDLVKLNKYDQALKNVNKRLKKDARNQHFLLVKASLFFENGQLEDARSVCNQLLELNETLDGPDVSQIACLQDLYYLVEFKLGGDPDANKIDRLWKKSVSDQPSPEAKLECAKGWARRSIENSQWTSVKNAAERVFSLLPNNDPSKQGYYFWRVVAHWLSKPHSDAQYAKIGRQTAVRMLQRAAEQNPRGSGATGVKFVPPISKPAENDLLIETSLCEDLKTAKEDPRTKLGDLLAPKLVEKEDSTAQDKLGRTELRWNYVKQLPFDENSWELNKTLLHSAIDDKVRYRADDYSRWLGVIHIAKTGDTSANDLIDKALEWDPKLRSARMALIQLNADMRNIGTTKDETEVDQILLPSLRNYFADFATQSSCSADLISLTKEVPLDQFWKFLKQIDVINKGAPQETRAQKLHWLIREANALDLLWHYFSQHSQLLLKDDPDDGQGRVGECLDTFLRICVRSYNESLRQSPALPYTDRNPGDKFCLLAVRALVKLHYHHAKRPHYLIQALCLLKYLVKMSPSNFDARIALISLRRVYGLISRASDGYKNLKVKGILINSCAPLLFTRAGLIQPFSGSAEDHSSLSEVLHDHVNFYPDALAKIPQYQTMALDNGNYVETIRFEDLKSKLRTSATKSLLAHERALMFWFQGKATKTEPADSDDLSLRELSRVLSVRSLDLEGLSALEVTPLYVQFIAYMQQALQFCEDLTDITTTKLEYFRKQRDLMYEAEKTYQLLPVEQSALIIVDRIVDIFWGLTELNLDVELPDLIQALKRVEAGLDELECLARVNMASVLVPAGTLPHCVDYHGIYTSYRLVHAYFTFCREIKRHCSKRGFTNLKKEIEYERVPAARDRLLRVTFNACQHAAMWWVSLRGYSRRDFHEFFFGAEQSDEQGRWDEGSTREDCGKKKGPGNKPEGFFEHEGLVDQDEGLEKKDETGRIIMYELMGKEFTLNVLAQTVEESIEAISQVKTLREMTNKTLRESKN